MSYTKWDPEIGPRISVAWHAIRDHLESHGSADRDTLIAVATSASDIVDRTALNLLSDLRNHRYLSRRQGIYRLHPSATTERTNP